MDLRTALGLAEADRFPLGENGVLVHPETVEIAEREGMGRGAGARRER